MSVKTLKAVETRQNNAVKSQLLDLALYSALCTFIEADTGWELTEKSETKPMQQAGKTLKEIHFHKPFWIAQPPFIREKDENVSV